MKKINNVKDPLHGKGAEYREAYIAGRYISRKLGPAVAKALHNAIVAVNVANAARRKRT